MPRPTKSALLCDVHRAVLRICVALSLVNVLSVFLEANMWHHTNPSQTGFSYFGGVTYIACLCFSPFFFLFECVQRYRPGRLLVGSLSVLVPLVLLVSATPALDERPRFRTMVLGTGVSAIPFVILYVFCNPRPSAGYGCSPRRCPSGSNPLSKIDLGSQARPERAAQCAAAEISLAIFLNMSIRWCSASVNPFAESWQACCVLLASVAMLGIVGWLWDSANAIKARRADSTSTTVTENGYETPEKPSPEPGFGSEIKKTLIAKENPGKNSDAPSAEGGSPMPACYKYVAAAYSMVCGLALGSHAHLFLWFFGSPDFLRRWSGLEEAELGFVFLLGLGLGCAIAILWPRDVQSKRGPFDAFSKVVLVALLYIATSLQLWGRVPTVQLPGSFLFALVLPQTLAINIVAVRWINRFGLGTSDTGLIGPLRMPLSIVVVTSSITFCAAEMTTMLFVTPNLSTVYLGKMQLILYPEISMIACHTLASVFVSGRCRGHTSAKRNGSSDTKDDAPSGLRKSLANFQLKYVVFIAVIALGTTLSGRSLSLNHCLVRHRSELETVRSALTPTSSEADNASIAILSWNVLFGHDMKGRDNLDCLAQVAKASRANVVALQESDALPVFWGGKDIVAYLQNAVKGLKAYYGVEPLKSSLGVGLLTSLRVIDHEAYILPNNGSVNLPHYSMTKTAIDVSAKCSRHDRCSKENRTLYVFAIHAVFKNWTELSPPVSTLQMNFIARHIRSVDHGSPIIAAGDFNLNPFESELDVFYDDLGFQSAFFPNRTTDNGWTLRNRNATVDHIFYRGLRLKRSLILKETDTVSDHYPVFARFELPT